MFCFQATCTRAQPWLMSIACAQTDLNAKGWAHGEHVLVMFCSAMWYSLYGVKVFSCLVHFRAAGTRLALCLIFETYLRAWHHIFQCRLHVCVAVQIWRGVFAWRAAATWTFCRWFLYAAWLFPLQRIIDVGNVYLCTLLLPLRWSSKPTLSSQRTVVHIDWIVTLIITTCDHS